MKESFEQPQIVPEETPEAKYLEQGVRVQKALDVALFIAGTRKDLSEKKSSNQIPKEIVQYLKEQYNTEFKRLQELQANLPHDTQEEYSKLDRLEQWEDALDSYKEDPEATRKFIRKETTPVVPIDPQTEPGWNKLHLDDQVEKMTDYLKKKEESEELEKAA